MGQQHVNAHAALKRFVATYPSQAAAAEAFGFSPAFLSMLLKRQKRIPDTVLARLGLRRRTIIVDLKRRANVPADELAS